MMKRNQLYKQFLLDSSKRKKHVIKLRKLGLTWAAIGKEIGVSRQRAQKIGSSA